MCATNWNERLTRLSAKGLLNERETRSTISLVAVRPMKPTPNCPYLVPAKNRTRRNKRPPSRRVSRGLVAAAEQPTVGLTHADVHYQLKASGLGDLGRFV